MTAPPGPASAGLDQLVDYYLPLLVVAGDYARALQPAIRGPGSKSGDNAWTQALTDADEGVQAFFEVATRAVDPELGFFGEEQERSRNARYFPAHARRTVWLDPINGTFLYQNQRRNWDIILSISDAGRLAAVISYMPVTGQFYLAVGDRGALTGTRASPRLAACEPLRINGGSNHCLTYASPAELGRVRRDFTAWDIVADDDPARDLDTLNHIFGGRLDAYLSTRADLLDWGAMAYVVVAAGGVATDLDGRPTDAFTDFGARAVPLAVSATPAIHERLLRALARH
jgi:fructose-1,6-bisphosphatase/inositol monophosphatase family enzyme